MMSMRASRIVALVVLLGLLAGCGGGETPTPTPTTAPPAQPSPTPEATAPPPTPTPVSLGATVVEVINDVDAHPEPEGEWEDAVVDMPIYLGGEVWAQEASTSRVGVEDDLIRVAPNTIFTFEQPDEDTLQLTLDEGQVWVNVEGLEPGETFQVETPAAVASVRGTRFDVRAEPDQTIVSTWVGTTTVTAVGSTVVVTRGMQAIVPLGGPPGAPVPMLPPQQIRWGMAVGPGLGVVLPAVGNPGTFGYPGFLFSRDWSHDGRYFALSYLDLEAGKYTHAFYDASTGGAVSSPLPSDATGILFNPVGDKMSYQHPTHPGTNKICTVGMDGANPACWGGDALYGWSFWSRDGKTLLFYSNAPMMIAGGGGYLSSARRLHRPLAAGVGQSLDVLNLFRANPDGSGRVQLTFDEAGFNIRQSWSPDGERIAYVRTLDYSGPGDVWVMDADGSNPHMLFEGAYGNELDHVAWSPDGSLLAVPKEEGGLWLVPTDGSEPWVVSGTEGWRCWTPVWSPTDDGWPLFFYSDGPEQDRVMLWYVSEVGEEPQGLAYANWGPIWTQDGSRLAVGFVEISGGLPQSDIYFFQSEPDFITGAGVSP